MFSGRVLLKSFSKAQLNRSSLAARYSTIGVVNVRPSKPISLYTVEKKAVSTDELFPNDKKVVVVGVPIHFSPVCSNQQIPNFLEKADELKSKGVDKIYVVSVSDPFAMSAWREKLGADKLEFIADPNAEFSKHLGVDLDFSAIGCGTKAGRYTILVDKGKIVEFNVEESPGDYKVTKPEQILQKL